MRIEPTMTRSSLSILSALAITSALLGACAGSPAADRAADPSATSAVDQVRAASKAWIAAFNAGDVDGCVAGYHSDAVMEAKPMGTFEGTEAIDGFWRPFMGSGAGELVYRNVKLVQVDDHTVTLSAEWSMNVGRGIITEERWVARDDGRWRLAYDAFEIQEQFKK